MEQRLINANDLERYAIYCENGQRYIPWVKIAEVPTAGETIIHAKWKSGHIAGFSFCSNCECICTGEKTKYCSNCGAKMDGGNQNG